jgi:hypothetical protein
MTFKLNKPCVLACWLALMVIFSCGASHAHDPGDQRMPVLPFSQDTWARLQQSGPRPAAYLFTTTYCAVCPQVFAELRSVSRSMRPMPALYVVMIDAQGDEARRHAGHFRGLTRLYAFDGFEPAIREAVDPTWHNITPYVVLINARGQVERTLGSPGADMLRHWAR